MPRPSHFRPLGLVAVLLLASSAAAQQIDSPYRFIEKGQEGGGYFQAVSPDAGRFGFGPKDGTALGLRYAVELGGPLALEGNLGFFTGTRDIIDPSRDEGDRVLGEADVERLDFDARLRFSLTGRRTWNRIAPYLMIGGGLAFDLSGDAALDEDLEAGDRFDFGTEFTAVFGGGLRVLLTERFALRPELGVNLYRLQTPSGYMLEERGFEAVAESEWINAGFLSISLAYLF